MKRIILFVAAVAVLLLAGCPSPSTPSGPEDEVWISPGKVVVSNLYPGAENVEYPLTIHNGNDQPTEFSLTFVAAGDVDKDTGYVYVAAPEEAQDWVIIADASPVLEPKETREVLVSVEMPEDAVAPAERWEFRIIVKDESQSGMIQTSLTCRWLVTMR
jgi:hypothetical protein